MKNGPSKDLLSRLKPDAGAMLDRLRPLIDDRMLDVIARADYGTDAEEHGTALKAIRDDGVIPAPMQWY